MLYIPTHATAKYNVLYKSNQRKVFFYLQNSLSIAVKCITKMNICVCICAAQKYTVMGKTNKYTNKFVCLMIIC